MLHAGLDLSRKKIDVCLLSPVGEIVDEWASPPDADGLRGLAARAGMWGSPVRGVIESMNGARFVHDRLEEHGRDVLIADATKVKGLAPLGCKTDKLDARVLATLSPAIWWRRSGCPTRASAVSASSRGSACISFGIARR
jgi:transposase